MVENRGHDHKRSSKWQIWEGEREVNRDIFSYIANYTLGAIPSRKTVVVNESYLDFSYTDR